MVRSVMTALALTVAFVLVPAPGLAQQENLTHVVQEGETLAILAQRYLGDHARWPELLAANRDRVTDPNLIEAGVELTIPAASLAETEERLLRMEQADRRPETRRSSFYGSDPMARRAVEVRGAEVERRLAVPADVFYSAEWLVPGVARPLGGGTLTEFVGMEQARRFQGAMARPFDRIQVALKPGFTARPGEELQIFRIVRQTSGLGWVAKPTGSATVVADEGESLVVEVNRQFAPIALGDHVRALPIFPLEPGQHPSDVTLGSASATLIEWGDPHQLQQYGDVAFLDVGANDGVAVGDEYVVAARTAQGFNSDIAGRLQVVGVGDDVSSARIIQQDGPVFSKGTEVFLARKMR